MRPTKRDILNKKIMALYRPCIEKFGTYYLVPMMKRRYNVEETRLMTVEQLEDMADYMESAVKGRKTQA